MLPHNHLTTKQITPVWHEIRDGSSVSGSTLFKACGLGLLREQQEHFDKVFKGYQPTVKPALQKLFDRGAKEEPNALATLVGKILPVYFPALKYFEDGCNVISLKNGYLVVSGDGSGLNDDLQYKVAFEMKCPKPGKTHTPDVHYRLAVYYSTQVLSQMATKCCNTFAYICYTPESCTFIQGKFDEKCWDTIWQYLQSLYGIPHPVRPQKKYPHASMIRNCLNNYCTDCPFVAEFPSLLYRPCSCTPTDNEYDAWGTHHDIVNSTLNFNLCDMTNCLTSALQNMTDAWNILWRPAKKVLVTVVSDLHRFGKFQSDAPHAVPIQYGLSGYSKQWPQQGASYRMHTVLVKQRVWTLQL